MNLLECTKVNTFFEFTKQNDKIFKKKLFSFVNAPFRTVFLPDKTHLSKHSTILNDSWLFIAICDFFWAVRQPSEVADHSTARISCTDVFLHILQNGFYHRPY